jgi:hypothetical protein
MFRLNSRTLYSNVLVLVSLSFFSCSDDSTTTPDVPEFNSPWVEVALPDTLPKSVLMGIAFSGTRGLALGAQGSSQGYVLEFNGASWQPHPLPTDVNDFPLAVAMDAAGRGVVVGARSDGAGSPAVFAERPTWTRVPLPEVFGGLQCVAVDASGNFLAAGPGNSSVLALTGTATGSWTQLSIPLPGDPQEKALVDLASRAGTWAGCGFDDGGQGDETSPFSVVLRNDGTGWDLLSGPGCGGCGNREYRAVAINDRGALLLGGAKTDFSAGADDEYVAFLASYNPSREHWTEILLPESGVLDRVNDILVTTSGDVYLACGLDTQTLVHHHATGGNTIEWRSSEESLTALAEDEVGNVYAVGVHNERLPGDPPGTYRIGPPFMLRRPANL